MVDPLNPRALYLQLADVLAERIAAGDWQPGRPMTSEDRLAEEYGLARGTVRSAVAELRRRGLVVTMPQRGTYVVEQARESPAPEGSGDGASS